VESRRIEDNIDRRELFLTSCSVADFARKFIKPEGLLFARQIFSIAGCWFWFSAWGIAGKSTARTRAFWYAGWSSPGLFFPSSSGTVTYLEQ